MNLDEARALRVDHLAARCARFHALPDAVAAATAAEEAARKAWDAVPDDLVEQIREEDIREGHARVRERTWDTAALDIRRAQVEYINDAIQAAWLARLPVSHVQAGPEPWAERVILSGGYVFAASVPNLSEIGL